MSEVIAELPDRILDSAGREFDVAVVGDQRPNGEWEGWLEFVPLDERDDVLLTPTETTQPNRGALEHWAGALRETYVQGAFRRAVSASTGTLSPRVAAQRLARSSTPLNDVDLPDPFKLADSGPDDMRARLDAVSRPVLQNIIDSFGLNPAGKDLSGLSERQLVTFIMTAVEAQIAMGRPSA
jgi:hypothetical protein